MIENVLIAVVVLLVITPPLIWAQRRANRQKLARAWRATVTDIRVQRGLTPAGDGTRRNPDTLYVIVVYRRDDGSEDSFQVGGRDHDDTSCLPGAPSVHELISYWHVGDVIAKQAGEEFPSRVFERPAA